MRQDLATLRNRAKAIRRLALLLSLRGPQTTSGRTLEGDTPNFEAQHLRAILSTPPILLTTLTRPLRTDSLTLPEAPSPPPSDNAEMGTTAEDIRDCYKAHRLATRHTINHARKMSYANYGRSLLRLFTKKPKSALKAVLKSNTRDHLKNKDPTPTDLTAINDHIHGGTTFDPDTIIEVVEDLQRKALSRDPTIAPDAPFPWGEAVPPTPQPTTNMIKGRLDRAVFDEALRRNPDYKAPGPDNIPGVILNNMPEAFLAATLQLFQIMAATGITPQTWLQTNTILLYKKGDPLNLDNYRPIALAPVIYKLWASCLTIMASRYVESNKILSPEQEGFRGGRSTARAILHLLLGVEDAHDNKKDVVICYLDFKGAYPSADHTQLVRTLRFLGIPEDFCLIVANLYQGATTTFTTPYGTTAPIPVLRGTLQGDPLSPLLFDLLMEPLIRWLNAKGQGYTFASTGLELASKWYADDATLISDSIPKMISQLQTVERYSDWSGIRLSVPKCCVTAFLQQLQSLHTKSARDSALEGRLAHISIGGRQVRSVSQDDPLPGGYLGTALTASLNPQNQITWIKDKLKEICKAVTKAPLPPRVKQQLLLYGAHSKIMHTHCLLALAPQTIVQLDAILEGACRQIWNLPSRFPRVAIHAPPQEWGLNLPTVWEDYCASAVRTWTSILNDQGALGHTARASLAAAAKYAQWPLQQAFDLTRTGTPVCTSLPAKCMATIIMGDLHPMGGPPIWEGNPISQALISAITVATDNEGCPLPIQPYPRIDLILRKLTHLWDQGITSWGQVARLAPGSRPYLLPEDELRWANPHLTHARIISLRRPIRYLHRLLASKGPEDMICDKTGTTPAPVRQGTIAQRWRLLLRTTLEALPPAPTPLELARGLQQHSIRSYSSLGRPATLQEEGPRPPLPPRPPHITLQLRDSFKSRPRHGRPKKARTNLLPPPQRPLNGHPTPRQAAISKIISLHGERPTLGAHRPPRAPRYLVEWMPITCTYRTALHHQKQGFAIVSLVPLDSFDESAPLEDAELDPPCRVCGKGGGASDDPDLVQCERCLQWIHSYCLPTPLSSEDLLLIQGWTCNDCAPPSIDNPCPRQLCSVTFAPSHVGMRNIRSYQGGRDALRAFRSNNQPASESPPTAPPRAGRMKPSCSPVASDPTSPGDPPPRGPQQKRPKTREGPTDAPPTPLPPHPAPPSVMRQPPSPRARAQQRTRILRGGTRRPPAKRDRSASPPIPPGSPCQPQPDDPKPTPDRCPSPPVEEHPIKRSSSAQAPTRKRERSTPPRAAHKAPRPTSPGPPPLRHLSHRCAIVLEEADPDRDTLPRRTPFAALVPPNSAWNTFNTPLVGAHFPSGATASPTLISRERFDWLHRQHAIHTDQRDFLTDFVSLMARYHPRSKALNPQGRSFCTSNQWALPYALHRAIHSCFRTTCELFASPLNCSMLVDMDTYASAFPEDTQFGALHDAFAYRWTGSCLGNPEYEPTDMHRAVTHALACSEATTSPLLVALCLPAWEDSPWQATSLRNHPNMETLVRLERGQLKFIPYNKQLDSALSPALLTPAEWPVELVVIANQGGREAFLDVTRLQHVLVPAIREACGIPDLHVPLFPRADGQPRVPRPLKAMDAPRHPLPRNSPPMAPDTPPRGIRPAPSDQTTPTPHETWPNEPSLLQVPVRPLPQAPLSLVEICGGIATGLEALLRAGHSIRTYAWADINPDAHKATLHRLQRLQDRYPTQLPASAILGWDRRLPFNANCLSPDGITHMFPQGIDLVIAGPPCQPFSKAGRHRGLEDPRSKALLNVARLIYYLHSTQPGGVTYIIENVPGTDRHPEVQRMLGTPAWLDAPQCGSGAHRETLFWQNLTTTDTIQTAFRQLARPTEPINDRLRRAGLGTWTTQPKGALLTSSAPGHKAHRLPPYIALPKFVCFKGSHAFRIKRGLPGPGMLYKGDLLREPDAQVRASLMGFHPGDIDAPGLSEDQQCHLLGQCIDINLFEWFIRQAAPARAPPTDGPTTARPSPTPPLPAMPLAILAPGAFSSNKQYIGSQPIPAPPPGPPPLGPTGCRPGEPSLRLPWSPGLPGSTQRTGSTQTVL